MKKDTIINGDAYQLIKDIPDKSVDLIYTDIPYLGKMSKQNSCLHGFGNIINVNKFYDGIDLSIIADFFEL